MARRISIMIGTRPEAVKLCPVVRALGAEDGAECHVCLTGQHRDLAGGVLASFGISASVDLGVMRPDQRLASLTSAVLTQADAYLAAVSPDLVLVQGDTTTAFAASLAAFYNRIPVGHVEAGLRTGDMRSPWPEEANRVLTARLASLHFAPTARSRENLLKEGVPDERIFVTGNTVIDALFFALEQIGSAPPAVPGLPAFLQPGSEATGPRMVLVTGHRRESFGEGFESICRAIDDLATEFPDVHFVYPVHLNPRVREPVFRILRGSAGRPNIHLVEPLSYLPFVGLMMRSCLILTDSGGIQEEAPALGKPVLVMRRTTERPEGPEAGLAVLVGTRRSAIVHAVRSELLFPRGIPPGERPAGPYGDGQAARRIAAVIRQWEPGP